MDVIFDVDGTLFDITHRVHLIRPSNGEKKNWKAFRACAVNDRLIEPMAQVARFLYQNQAVRLLITTGRMEEERLLTTRMLNQAGVFFCSMYMRQDGDYRPDFEVKLELLAELRADGYDPKLVFDDRQSVVDMWRAQGLLCCQVAPGQF